MPKKFERSPKDWWSEEASGERALAKEREQSAWAGGFTVAKREKMSEDSDAFFQRQLGYVTSYASYEQMVVRIYRDTMPDTMSFMNAAAYLYGVRYDSPYEAFIKMVKKIVNLWADSLDDTTKRAAMLELYLTPR
jgi:hypothetical protein